MSDASSNRKNKFIKFPEQGPQVPWGPVAAITVTILAFVGAQVMTGLALVAALDVLGMRGDDGLLWFNSVAGQFYFVLISDALILLTVWLFLRSRGAKANQVGLARRPIWRDFGLALLGYSVYFVLLLVGVSLVDLLTNVDFNQKQELGFDSLLTTGEKLMAFASLVVLAPIVEEIVFRGFLFTGLRKKMKFIGAAIVTSLLFAAPHLFASSYGLLWAAGIDTFILSLVLCYLREQTGALWTGMAIHALKNGIAFVLLLSGVASL